MLATFVCSAEASQHALVSPDHRVDRTAAEDSMLVGSNTEVLMNGVISYYNHLDRV